jgi:CubicO group peptidase (beta-lactamase class C family)
MNRRFSHGYFRRVLLAIALTISLIVIPHAGRTAYAAPDPVEIDKLITDLMALYDVPGVGLALVQDGEVRYSKGYGLRNTTDQTPVGPNTAFAIGSVTKSFTALGVQLLAAEGKVDLDAPITTYIPDLKLSDAEALKTLSLRHLLSHTSGLSSFDTGQQVLTANQISRAEFIQAISTMPLLNQPGKGFIYANQNFVLAGLVIERVTGKTWEDFVLERIFTPLGMTNASYDEIGLTSGKDTAAPHDLDVFKGMIPVPFTPNLSAIGPAGSINAGAEDMARYALFHLTGKSADGSLTLSKDRLDELHKPVIGIGPSQPGPNAIVTELSYALGWLTENYRGLRIVQHSGNVIGYSANVTLIPEKGIGIVLLANSNYANLLLDVARLRLIEMLVGLPSERDLVAAINTLAGYKPDELKAALAQARAFRPDPAALNALTGDYSGSMGKITMRAASNRLYAKVEATGVEYELVPLSAEGFIGNTFPYRGNRFTFVKTESGTLIRLGNANDGVEWAVRAAAGVTTKEIKDSQGRFTVQIPADLTAQSLGNLTLIVAGNMQLFIAVVAYPVVEQDLIADYEAFARTLDPNFKDKPLSTKTVTVNGREWTELEYPAPSGQISMNYLYRENGINYYFGYLTAKNDVEKYRTTLDLIFNSFTIK